MHTYTHKKQTGGPGEWARIEFDIQPAPWTATLQFDNLTTGGCIPDTYADAVRDGVLDAMKRGVLGEGPLVGIRFLLIGGATHPNDSSEEAFRRAGHDGFRTYIREYPIGVLEPIVALDVSTMRLRETINALASHDIVEVGAWTVRARVPQAALADIGDALASCTGGDAEWTWRFSHYAVRR